MVNTRKSQFKLSPMKKLKIRTLPKYTILKGYDCPHITWYKLNPTNFTRSFWRKLNHRVKNKKV